MPRKSPDPVLHIQQLARSFPELAFRHGIDPWEPDVLDAWAMELIAHRAWDVHAAAQFVLGVWDRGRLWRCGRFEVVHAMTVWNEGYRAVFLAWAERPWWVEDGVRRTPKRPRARF